MSKYVPEACARRGAEGDLLYLARLYGVMQPKVRLNFLADEALSQVSPDVGNLPEHKEHGDAVQEIVRLLERYVDSSCKDAILNAAAQWIALQQISMEPKIHEDFELAHDWLTCISKETFPCDGYVSVLVDFVTGTDSDWPSFFFIDGWLNAVLCTSDGEYRTAEGMYAGYEYMRSTVLHGIDVPEPAQFLQVRVEKQDFSNFDFETGWSFDQGAYDLEVRHQCVLKFTSFVRWWRGRFFERVISKEAA